MSTLRSNLTAAINKSDQLLKIAPKQSFSHPPPLQLSSALERVATLAPSATKPISTFTIGEVADRLRALRAEKKYLAGQHFDFIFLTVLFTVGRLLLERQAKLTQESSPTELQAEFMRICKEMARRGQLPPELGPLPTSSPHTGLSHTSLVFLYVLISSPTLRVLPHDHGHFRIKPAWYTSTPPHSWWYSALLSVTEEDNHILDSIGLSPHMTETKRRKREHNSLITEDARLTIMLDSEDSTSGSATPSPTYSPLFHFD
jgi:hypothetical protein